MRSRAGEQTRTAILEEAAQLASVRGLEGLSLGKLATATGMSKSGLYAHFGSKEELQLATIETARAKYMLEVVQPGLAAARGIERLRATCEAFLSYVERNVFPGGCFYAAATSEVKSRPGRVRDAIADDQRQWLGLLENLVKDAQAVGELSAEEDAVQLAFELNAILFAGNNSFLLYRDPAAIERARVGIAGRLATAAPA